MTGMRGLRNAAMVGAKRRTLSFLRPLSSGSLSAGENGANKLLQKCQTSTIVSDIIFTYFWFITRYEDSPSYAVDASRALQDQV